MNTRKLIWSFLYLILYLSFYLAASFVINAARRSGFSPGINFVWLLNAVGFCCGLLMGLPTFVNMLTKKGEKRILIHRLIFIVPIVLFEIWYNIPMLGFPYSSHFSYGFVSELLFAVLGFTLITIVGFKDEIV